MDLWARENIMLHDDDRIMMRNLAKVIFVLVVLTLVLIVVANTVA